MGAAAILALSAAGPGHAAQLDRSVLPIPPAPFDGRIAETWAASTPPKTPPGPVRAPQGAPNIFLFLGDDVGFAMSSTFGGPVPTPNMDRLAVAGQRYNRFHTTAICSPTRAALLTGRNTHRVGTGFLVDAPSGYPGYDGRFPASAATIAETLKLNGYNTAMFGKHHNIPNGEDTAAGPFDMWPTGLGFEYYFGFISADSDQWSPNLYRGTSLLPDVDGPLELTDKRLADDAIRWVHNQKAAAPDKPFFIYMATGSTHAPHQAPPEWIAKFKGRFDQGWDKLREETYRRQLAQGVIPRDAALTARPAAIPAWSSLTPQQKAYAARSMEVAAAQLAYQDAQVGRVLDELQRMGQLDKTLVIAIQGDNGASGEGGVRGTINEVGRATNGIAEDDAWLAANLDKLGGPETYETYPVGFAWAMNAPFRWTKQFASMLGGVRNGMIVSWEGHVAHPGTVCSEFGHVVDIAPTLLDAAGVPAPESVYGVKQMTFDGRSLTPSFSQCSPDKPRTQYFEMAGKVGLYRDGWFLSSDDGRLPWDVTSPPTAHSQSMNWELYDLRSDFSQSKNVAATNPGILSEMVAEWKVIADRNQVFPLAHNLGLRGPPQISKGPQRFEYWGSDIDLMALRAPMLAGRSFTIEADVETDRPDASGAIFAIGSRFGGFSFYLDEGRPTLTYALSTHPDEITTIQSREAAPAGASRLSLRLKSDGFASPANVELLRGATVIASGRIPQTLLSPAGLGEMLNVGRDTGTPVTDYPTPHGRLEGRVPHLTLTLE